MAIIYSLNKPIECLTSLNSHKKHLIYHNGMIVNNTNTSQHGHAIQGGERDKEIPLFSFQMPGKFGSLYQHSKQTQKSDTSTMFHQQFLCFSLPESLGQTVAEWGGQKKKKKK